MTVLEARRRLLLMSQQPKELYPVGTDICDYYGFKETATSAHIRESDGEVVEGGYWTSTNYAEIDPSYTYAKKYYRLYRIAYYDADKTYINSTTNSNNLTDMDVIDDIPANARYVRISMYQPIADQYYRVGMVRIK